MAPLNEISKLEMKPGGLSWGKLMPGLMLGCDQLR
jgi:hypothetical protein